MKKTFLFLVAALFCTSIYADQAVTINPGGTATQAHFPIYGANADTKGQKVQAIYLANQLTGITAGSEIKALTFYSANQTQSWGKAEFKVSLAKTDFTFFQNASHELRTPLMSIQGYAEGLKYGVFESDEDRNNAIDVIIDETGRLSGLVENLLSISKMDMSKSGNYEVKKQTINARKICDTIIDRVRGNFIHEDKAIINDIKIKNAYIYGNENDLIRCLENIFSNCLRYCKTAVTLRCYKDKNEDSVVFEISDDGPGIAPEVADHLFERFSKGSDGKHGIGLALALAIAEEHGGTVKAHNKETGGACFEIIIPCVKRRDQLSKMNNDSTT